MYYIALLIYIALPTILNINKHRKQGLSLLEAIAKSTRKLLRVLIITIFLLLEVQQETDTNDETNVIKSVNFTGSNREKYNIVIIILEK